MSPLPDPTTTAADAEAAAVAPSDAEPGPAPMNAADAAPGQPATAPAAEAGDPAGTAQAADDAQAAAAPAGPSGPSGPSAAPESGQAPGPSETPAPDGPAAAAIAAATSNPPAPRPAELSPAACADLLRQHFPALFTGAPKPMKLRIQQDIQQRAPGVFSKAALGAYFRRYTGSTGYLIALGKATQRFDLDGQPAGELSEEHRQLARDELARRRQISREREQQAQAQAQAAQAELWQARQDRATLLRDFERTTLTLANFCALKGLTPENLTPQLDIARREAAEAPPRAADERRGAQGWNGPRGDGRPMPRRDERAPQGQDRPSAARAPRHGAPGPDASRRDTAPRGPGKGPRPPGGPRSH